MAPRRFSRKLDTAISRNREYGLFGPLSPSPFSPFSKSKLNKAGGKRIQLCSLFVISGFGLLVCVLCYASYFPAGVVWITALDSSSVKSNQFLNKQGSKEEVRKTQSLSASLFKGFSWKFQASKSSDLLINHEHQKGESGSDANEDIFQTLLTFEESRKVQEMQTEERRSCNFPRLNPFDASIREFIKDPPNVDCFANHPLVFRTNFRNKLIQVNKMENATCCYKTVTRGNESDHNVRYSKKCFQITQSETEIPADHEFIYLKCSQPVISNETNKLTTAVVHRDMFAFVHRKPEVESRLEQFQRHFHQSQIAKSSSRSSLSLPTSSKSIKGMNNDQKEHLSQEEQDKLSILILGLDAQSHMNFLRQMPLTFNFLRKNLSAIGLQGYTKVGDNTFPNTVPLLSGLNVAELKKLCWPSKSSYFDDCPFIWKNFSEAGYRTSFSEDSIWMGTFNYEKKGFMDPPTDYYLHPLSLLMAKKIGHETWGNAKLCYGPRLAFEVLLDYILKTAVAFNSQLYFQYVWANSLFHDYLNNPKLGDELLYLTLDYLQGNGYLNNTLLILLSDHGIRWGSIRSTYQGKIEERMPMAYFAFPLWFRTKYPKAMANFAENANSKLTTPFDVYETLVDMLDLGRMQELEISLVKSKTKQLRGISLFRQIGADRTCKSAGIEEHWCVCNSLKSIGRNSSLVIKAADFIVNEINQGLSKFRGECAKLSLYKINEAMRKIDGDIDSGAELQNATDSNQHTNDNSNDNIFNDKHEIDKDETDDENDIKSTISSSAISNSSNLSVKGNKIQLQITLVTKPGFAVFETTVYGDFDGRVWNISGEISRLNLYREQSLCIRDYVAQKYCYCLNQRIEDDESNQD